MTVRVNETFLATLDEALEWAEANPGQLSERAHRDGPRRTLTAYVIERYGWQVSEAGAVTVGDHTMTAYALVARIADPGRRAQGDSLADWLGEYIFGPYLTLAEIQAARSVMVPMSE